MSEGLPGYTGGTGGVRGCSIDGVRWGNIRGGRNFSKGVVHVARRRGVMSEQFKYELAKELGFFPTLQRDGWGGITTRDAGNMVKRAIEIAEASLVQRERP